MGCHDLTRAYIENKPDYARIRTKTLKTLEHLLYLSVLAVFAAACILGIVCEEAHAFALLEGSHASKRHVGAPRRGVVRRARALPCDTGARARVLN